MDRIEGMWAKKKEGQHFLVDRNIAQLEAAYANGLRVIEVGAGLGMLTEELCKKAKDVIAVEKDVRLFEKLEASLNHKNLKLICSDFFDLDFDEIGKIDMMVANIPYSLSSKIVGWLGAMQMPAVLCVQKEFAGHMSAKPGSRSYSRLSVMSSLRFKIYNVRAVPAGDFYPPPKVDSAIVYIVPKNKKIGEDVAEVITMIMNHKKKTVRNAIIDSEAELGLTKEQVDKIIGGTDYAKIRPVHLEPEKILEIAEKVVSAEKGIEL